ncbi:uncharacterized protein LOC133627375 [Colius striatus]|uniref:uncharacterized protein LOC133627375 n=1 Tax=Colius striatus TaxID=57412 RepID=UPI002B1DCD6D|nr:uncharacterized protein LOC133627375 [Colius striatus]
MRQDHAPAFHYRQLVCAAVPAQDLPHTRSCGLAKRREPHLLGDAQAAPGQAAELVLALAGSPAVTQCAHCDWHSRNRPRAHTGLKPPELQSKRREGEEAAQAAPHHPPALPGGGSAGALTFIFVPGQGAHTPRSPGKDKSQPELPFGVMLEQLAQTLATLRLLWSRGREGKHLPCCSNHLGLLPHRRQRCTEGRRMRRMRRNIPSLRWADAELLHLSRSGVASQVLSWRSPRLQADPSLCCCRPGLAELLPSLTAPCPATNKSRICLTN